MSFSEVKIMLVFSQMLFALQEGLLHHFVDFSDKDFCHSMLLCLD